MARWGRHVATRRLFTATLDRLEAGDCGPRPLAGPRRPHAIVPKAIRVSSVAVGRPSPYRLTSLDRPGRRGAGCRQRRPDGHAAPPCRQRGGQAQRLHDPGIVLLFGATRVMDLGAVPGPTQDVTAVQVPSGQHQLLSVAT